MNNIAIAGLVGGGIGAVKGIIDQKEAQKYDPQAGTSVGSYISNSLRDGLGFAAIAAGGAGIAAAVKNPKAVAEAISGSKIKESKLYKTIIPGKDEFYKEVTNMINNDDKLKASLKSQDVEKTIATKIKEYANGAKIDISDETAQKIAHAGNGVVTDEAFENINKALQENGLAKEKTDKLTSKLQKYAQDVLDKPIDNPKEKYDLYYNVVRKLLRKYLPKGKNNEVARKPIYEEINTYLTRGQRKDKRGYRHADSRMAYSVDYKELVNILSEWAANSRNVYGLYDRLRDLNKSKGYGVSDMEK